MGHAQASLEQVVEVGSASFDEVVLDDELLEDEVLDVEVDVGVELDDSEDALFLPSDVAVVSAPGMHCE